VIRPTPREILIATGLVIGFWSYAGFVHHQLGVRDERIRAAQVESKIHKQAAQVAVQEAKRLSARGDSLIHQILVTDSLSKVSGRKLTSAVTNYGKLRKAYDSLVAETGEHDPVQEALNDAADATIAAAQIAISRKDGQIAARDSLITNQSRQISSLNTALSEKDQQIRSLNTEVKLVAKQKPGLIARTLSAGKWIGVGVVLGAVVVR
jgi:hypothetical protein